MYVSLSPPPPFRHRGLSLTRFFIDHAFSTLMCEPQSMTMSTVAMILIPLPPVLLSRRVVLSPPLLNQAAMSATTTIIGEGSVRVGKALDQPDIPRKLSIVSSFVAITIGAVWLAKATLF